MTTTRISASVADFSVEKSRRADNRKNSIKTEEASQDSVSISADAALLQEAEALAKSAPDVDMDKVEEVRQAIVRGELKIDYEKLAQKMLDFEASLEPK
ncbi:flagellar biosynthesis anti-sigma factor FlgM [Parendozoicomonas sp. Alg238-R29]|uniref:flagellar biosynthesis anti-sigma factor FlgM n=1 Tax=Parendozoicomonas sp. Alg238-R29 TaxID=2993446 RepID=UPI00248E3AD5|nr:flagellar biosynthesis anti-sigma factor FlgM [Parendozoicomonas sp. Alg238-R29]